MKISDRMIIAAVAKGYYADREGRVFDPEGNELKGSPLKNSGHLRITMYADGVNDRGYCSVLKHRFIYYYYLGMELFKHPLVRHKNDIADDNRLDNLIAGTYKENRADIPKSKLSDIGKKNARLLIDRSRKLTDLEIVCMRKLHKAYKISYANLATLFNVSAMTAYRATNGKSWSNVNAG